MGRLPWIQLGAAFDLAPRLEGLLGVSYLEALGLLAQLDRVAVELAELGLFPGSRAGVQLVAAVRWPAARAEELIKALVEVGKVEAGPEGVRVLGLEWAGRALASQDASRARAEASRERRARTVREPCANRARTSWESARTVREGAALDQDLDQEVKQLPPPAGATGTGQAESAAGGIEPSGAAGELPLGLQVAPGAQVAAKAVKPRGKKANVSQEPTSAFQDLKSAMVAVYEARRRRKYPWHRRDPRGVQECLELERVHGREELLRHWARGLDRAGEKFATGREKVSYIWELPDAWGPIDGLLVAEGVAGPADPAAPQDPAWMAGEVGERWRQAVKESGRGAAFGEVAKLVVSAEVDIDVLRLVVQDANARDWIRQRTANPWSSAPGTSLLDMLQEWLGPVRIEVQPGGGE